MIIDTNKQKEQALSILKDLITKYNIKENIEDINRFFTSVYIQKDFKQKRVRLLGIKEEYLEDSSGSTIKTGEKKTVQLYVLSKRMLNTLPRDNVFEIGDDLATFVYYFTLLKKIKDLEAVIEEKDLIISLNYITDAEFEKYVDIH